MCVRTLFKVWCYVAIITLPSSVVDALIFRCPGSERCGIFGLFIVMHSGTPGTDTCQEFCVFIQDATLECGICNSDTDDQTAPENGEYDISLTLVDIPTSDLSIFSDAAQRWSSVIVGDLSSIPRSSLQSRFESGCSVPSTIDDLHICAQYARIDGSRQVLGFARPLDIRRSNTLPVTGEMTFDSADIDFLKSQGNFESVILHEMGHILGIGTLWDNLGVTGPINCPYRGPRANAEFEEISGCSVVPTEQDFGPGTRCGHFDEECMGSELMTGFAGSGNSPLSRITIATLDDLGYDVDYSSAESFTEDDLDTNCVCRRRRTIMDMINGETHQLGLRMPDSKRRKLSEEMYEMAMSFGREKLAEGKKLPSSSFGSIFDSLMGTASNAKVQFASSDVIAVFVMEDGEFYDVVVRSED